MSADHSGSVPAAEVPVTAEGVSLARTHLVGVGGAGMSGIARILVDRGLPVSGSDAKQSATVSALIERGVQVAVGHGADRLDLLAGGPTAVVVSTAVRPDNPELVAARERGIPVVRRAVALAALMTGQRAVCVAGTHGKTSTTSMLTVALRAADLDPSFMIGGELTDSGLAAHAGRGDVFVAEADESDGSFLAFAPHGAIVTNLEPDHLDHHGTAEAYEAVFEQFVERIEPGGFLVACADDPGSAALAASARRSGLRRVVTYGRSADAEVRLERDGSPAVDGGPQTAVLTLPGGPPVVLRLQVPGDHMMLNAAATVAAGAELGVDPASLAAGLATYGGVRRRFEHKGAAAGVTVYDDYAHHPTEVAAQLAAARSVVPSTGRLVVIFQPHLYSRTETFATEFGRALSAADVVVLLDVFAAREDPRPGVSGELIARAVDAAVPLVYEPDRAAATVSAARVLRDGDVVITMGAGDVTAIGPELLARLSAEATR
ncbi:UDP-N-acetylmuramate--L-alanine ligase [Nakamurella flava]|uniref:UDP-N-acetylmuramate--L-alanine ligase n=1 Tax=Nakamurella flava TaxID=2576308 RepID=A0A4U6Q8K8_9ACTN|nr:UDP-N-acetylmuramate--L-alanine ligase [Nakamurella flava]TKV56086.1 UDP-N-acetylmuramate--L-alanine ligase [Nakamurella flava]